MKEYKLVQTYDIDEAGINELAEQGWKLVATYPLAVSFDRVANNWMLESMLVFERDVPRDDQQETPSHPKTRRRSRKPAQPE